MLNGQVESSSRVEAKAILVLDLAAAAGVGKACAILPCLIFFELSGTFLGFTQVWRGDLPCIFHSPPSYEEEQRQRS